MRCSRRTALAAIACASMAHPGWATGAVKRLSPDDAYRRAQAGEIALVDIRTPEEWKESGVPEGAARISMQDPALGARLDALLDGDRSRPIALICRTGGRSAALSEAMARAGFSNVYDVSEGMMGSMRGPGWLRRGLPTQPVE